MQIVHQVISYSFVMLILSKPLSFNSHSGPLPRDKFRFHKSGDCFLALSIRARQMQMIFPVKHRKMASSTWNKMKNSDFHCRPLNWVCIYALHHEHLDNEAKNISYTDSDRFNRFLLITSMHCSSGWSSFTCWDIVIHRHRTRGNEGH